jgi:hypothetical protein
VNADNAADFAFVAEGLLEGMARGVEDGTPEGHTFTAEQVAYMLRETAKRLPAELKKAGL